MSPDRDLRRPRVFRPLRHVTALVGVLSATALGAVAVPSVAAADTPTTVVGELVRVWAEAEPGPAGADHDHADGHDAHEAGTQLSWVETDDGSVRVPAEQVATVPSGATVELTVGGTVEDEASDDGYEPARTVLAGEVVGESPATEPAASPRTGLTNEVTVVLVAPAGTTPDSTRLRDVVDTVDGPVARFWSEQTGGAISIGVTDSRDWLSTSAGCADPEALWQEVAAAVGFAAGPGKHLMLRLSSQTATQPACSYALAQVGTGPASGGRLYVRDTLASIIAHELGHNFGLGHSSAEQCDGAVESGSCRISGYRDFYDVMGASWAELGSLNAAQASALKVLPGDALRTVSVGDGATSVTLAPLAGTGGVRALRLVDAEGVAYWLELRSATGQDSWLAARDNVYRLDAGVLLRREGRFPDTSLLLDGTPGAAAGWDADLQAALPVGVAVPLSDGDFTVTVQSVSAAAAALTIVPSASTGTAEAPSAPVVSAATGSTMSGRAGAEHVRTSVSPDGGVAEADGVPLPVWAVRASGAPLEIPTASPVVPASASAPTMLPALAGVGCLVVGFLWVMARLRVARVRRVR